MGAENFNTFTKNDALSRLTVTSSRVTWTDLRRGDDQIFLYIDKGVGFFDGSFVHTMTVNQTSSDNSAIVICWALTNDLDDMQGLIDNSKDALFVDISVNTSGQSKITLAELDGGSLDGDPGGGFNSTDGVTYYFKITRDETASAFGDLTLEIFTDAERTVLVDTQTFSLNTSAKDFRYAMPVMSFDKPTAVNQKSTGLSQDLDIMGATQGATPQVSTQLPTAITATTATGNGTIADLGISSVTAHGWVWDTSPIDTAVVPGSQPNSTDEGAGALGPFTTDITGLTGGLTYFGRAYAVNTQGTTYGEGVQWKAGASYSVKEWGDTSMKGNELHIVGEDGVERALMGTPV